MKNFLTLLSFLMVSLTSAGQIVDVAPTGQPGYIPVEGGAIKMVPDRNTNLSILIKRFEKPWNVNETGKAYWIGYTNDMYSIAAYGSSAIAPLKKFIESTKDTWAKIGAVYTIHLIGIEGKVVGRFVEQFKNKDARNALLYLLKYPDLGQTIVSLLIRDPWLSDVPKLFLALKENNYNDWFITNALFRYIGKELPMQQAMPLDISQLKIKFPFKDMEQFDGRYGVEAQAKKMLQTIVAIGGDNVSVENLLFKSEIWGPHRSSFRNYANENEVNSVSIESFLNTLTSVGYTHYGNRIQYYVLSGKLYICSPATAKAKLLFWWEAQSARYKEGFLLDKADLDRSNSAFF